VRRGFTGQTGRGYLNFCNSRIETPLTAPGVSEAPMIAIDFGASSAETSAKRGGMDSDCTVFTMMFASRSTWI
jgi:hypothetical protein